METDILNQLFETIKDRKGKDPKDSYVSSLFQKGLDKILKKVGEESSEVIIASKNEDKNELIYELADLIFHLFVLMEKKEISLEEVKRELSRRTGKSGLQEKKERV